METLISYESVVLSSRIRLARNFADYPFPARLLRDAHAAEQASEIVRIVAGELSALEEFELYDIGTLRPENAAYLVEKHLISRDLLAHSPISAALISRDESISVMINEEDHIREQYFIKGYDLLRAYERISGIDDLISESIPFAYDETFGYLTACPSNLGTGMRASVMLFLPACSRRGVMRESIEPLLRSKGLTVRGAFGEGSGTEGELFQLSNEITLGVSESEILTLVQEHVRYVVAIELEERKRMKVEEGVALKDRVARAYGILTNCCRIEEREFIRRTADVKLGLALGYFRGKRSAERLMSEIDDLAVSMRPANIDRLNGEPLPQEEQAEFRADYTRDAFRKMALAIENGG